MVRKFVQLGIFMAAFVLGAAGQTNVTNGNNGTANTVPVYTSSATLGGTSPITIKDCCHVGIRTPSPTADLDFGDGSTQFSGTLSVRNNGSDNSNSIEWGALNPAGYGSTIGYLAGGGQPYIAFNGEMGTQPDTIKTRGIRSSIIISDLVGGIQFGNVPNSNADNQVFVPELSLLGSGNVGIGTTSPGAKLEINGNLRFSGDASGVYQTTAWTGVLCGGDYSEAVETTEIKERYEPGDVLVISAEAEGKVKRSSEPYATNVSGIYATKPGVVGKRESLAKVTDDIPMAMVGIVPTKVSAENGAIHPGDLLVTSSREGYAMKGTDRGKMLGAVIGKAMASLGAGTGTIEVLVTLQ